MTDAFPFWRQGAWRGLAGGHSHAWLLLLFYPLAFKAAHMVASPWGGIHFFSLWYPAAGVRFALLWHAGARYTPVIMIEECLIQLATGTISPAHPQFFDHLAGVTRAPLAYGVMVALARFIERRGTSELAIAPMPFGLAGVLAPGFAACVAGVWEEVWPGLPADFAEQPFASMIAAFLVGDLLGVLLVAPPLLWLASASGRAEPAVMTRARAVEVSLVFAIGWLMAAGLASSAPQIAVMPALIAAIWAGLRCGQAGAWVAIIVSAAIILPWSAALEADEMRFSLHMGLAAMAIAAYLAGCFAQAQVSARQDIARRDRILFQAERLKTLRAMSVAIIHEISQPLSTLAIETRHLSALAQQDEWDRPDFKATIALVERKTTLLADMVRRLRRFGGRAVDEPSPIPVSRLLRESIAMLESEAKRQGCRIELETIDGHVQVYGHEIELTQVLINLLRNAMQAARGTAIKLAWQRSGDTVAISIENGIGVAAPNAGGMGIGLLVARAIVNAHGGNLREDQKAGVICYTISLPLGGDPA
ncbi:MAG: HAMP domain-containing sensor histidine kinase [Pseudomonadota bacterium]|mgnify:CR=1 FL=1|tara:strand:+ start:474 stop:2072 length:1599 start_codon:yes stop_codon:yes gene_type:complete